jgi:hypothetical protein
MAAKSSALAAEEAVLDWIEDVVKEEVDDMYLHLKSGRTLCRLINTLNVGINLKYSNRPTAIHEMVCLLFSLDAFVYLFLYLISSLFFSLRLGSFYCDELV